MKRPGATPSTFRLARRGRCITSISALFFVIASKTASATCPGVTSPAIGLAFRPVSAHMPSPEMKVGEMIDTPTPVGINSRRGHLARDRRHEDDVPVLAFNHRGRELVRENNARAQVDGDGAVYLFEG